MPAALLVFALAAATPAAAWATVDDLVNRALALQSAGRSDEAYRLLAPATDARAGDPDFDSALGIAAADSGRYGEAITALQRVLAVQPGSGPARAELARVYALAGDIDTARAEFDTLVDDPTVPDPVRQRFDRLVRDYDRRIGGGGARVTGYIDAESGWDSNVNAATNLTSLTLPALAFLGPATLGGGATRDAEAFGQLQGGVSGEVGVDRQTRVYGSVLGLYRDAYDGRAFDQAALTGTTGIAYTAANRDVLSLSAQVQQFWLAHDPYRTSVGAIAQYTRALSRGRALSLTAQYSRLDYRRDPLRDADRFSLSAAYSTRSLFLIGSGGREDTRRAAGDHLSFTFLQATAGTELPLGERLAVVASANAEHRDYDTADPLFLRGRRDTQLDASLGLRFVLARGLSVRPRVTYTRNFSNLALYDYERATASLSLRAEF